MFASDFGEIDGAVSSMKGVAIAIDRALVIHDLTHLIPPFDVWEGAFRIAASAPSWPRETTFVCVVDPGVGTDRAPIVLETRAGRRFVGPDNGLFTVIAEREGIEAIRAIDVARHLRGSSASHTFHGRDLFAVVGAGLASGRLRFEDVGPMLDRDPVRLEIAEARLVNDTAGLRLEGAITVLDARFGNVWTNLPESMLADAGIVLGDRLTVRVLERDVVRFIGELPLAATFGDVPSGQPLAYVNSDLDLAFALNLGDFARTHSIRSGPDWRVEVMPTTDPTPGP